MYKIFTFVIICGTFKIVGEGMKKILILLFFVFVVTGCNNNDNQIVMVTEAGFAPYEFYDGDEIVGVDVEIAKEIAKSLGKELVIKDVYFNSIINELKSGKADFAAAGMSITEDRKKEVDFTIEYVTSNQVVVVKKGSNIKSVDDISDKRISVQLGTVADSYVEENLPNAKLNKLKTFLVAAEDVKNNKSDCIIMDKLPAVELVKKNPELEILDEVLFEDKYAIAVKKGNKELLDSINKVLTKLVNNGKIDEYIIEFSR